MLAMAAREIKAPMPPVALTSESQWLPYFLSILLPKYNHQQLKWCDEIKIKNLALI